MEMIIFYMLIFCIGTLFGSFFTLAVYRIPLHQDITHKRSYCPKCNHKLAFLDMIPILSYIFLGGKCRYCKEKIRIRYLFLEVFTGIVFTLFTMSININIYNLEISKLIYLVFGMLYFVGLIIIAGIDKEKHNVNKSVLIYQLVVVTTYMIYLYIIENVSMYRYVIYLAVLTILLILDIFVLRKKLKTSYPIGILILSILMASFTYEITFIITAIITLLAISIYLIISKISNIKLKYNKQEKSFINNMPIGFYLCCSNIIAIICINMIACR